MEKYDYPSTVLNQLIWRNYTAKIFSLFVVYFVNFYFILMANNQIFGIDYKTAYGCGTLQVTENNEQSAGNESNLPAQANTQYSTCREDNVSLNLLLNVTI